MNQAARQTRSYLMQLFERSGMHPRFDLGQNFLIDLNILEYVVDAADIGPEDVVLEIGSGTGSMTAYLAEQAGAVISVDIDPNMHRLTAEAVSGKHNVTLLNCDALKTKNQLSPVLLETIAERLAEDAERGLKLVANLPYAVATPVISNLVATDLPWRCMVATIQWELAERLRAAPKTSDFGALSVWLQAQCHVKTLKKVRPESFWPRPKVDSAIVQLLPDPAAAAKIADRAFFHDFIRRLFQQRRKNLRSVLVAMFAGSIAKTDIDELFATSEFVNPSARSSENRSTARAEELDVETLVKLGNRMWELNSSQQEGKTPDNSASEKLEEK